MNQSRRHENQLGRLSRFLLMLLRHQPARFPVKLDAQGFAQLDDVMRVVHALPNLRWATLADIEAVLAMPGPQRLEIVDVGGGSRRIRALYGHSVRKLAYDPVQPPDRLYFAVSPDAAETIRREGLHSGEDAYVHLTDDPTQACAGALREIPDPLVLIVDAAAAATSGVLFYSPVESVYLCEEVPPQFIA